MPRFLPSLRTKHQDADESKTVLADYYAALASSGLVPSYARSWPVERAVQEAYERLVWVYKSVEAIGSHACSLPFRFRKGEEIVEDHPLYGILNRRANPLETGRAFRKRLSAQVLLSKKGAFVEATRSRGGTIVRADLLPPGRTRPVAGWGDELIDHYEVIARDGTRRTIDAENVLWFREPHPLDPYSGSTPLEAAGLSAELDWFSRLYNVAFLKNDGRPGGIVGVDGDMPEPDMAKLESRFGHGPTEAGKVSVVNGKVTYTDVAVRPRDMQYSETAHTAKVEILAAFGVPESVLGYAADRTFDNAEQELYVFWTITMRAHLALLASGWADPGDDALEPFFDTAEVEVLQRSQVARRKEAREEFAAGLISPDEYREEGGKEAFDTPQSRALYVPSAGRTIVAASDEDAEALAPPPAKPETEAPAGEEAEEEEAEKPEAEEEGAEAAEEEASPPTKRFRLITTKQDHPKATAERVSTTDQQALAKLETALAAALTALTVRFTERTIARLNSPKTRKHTRHWVTEHKADTRAGAEPLDVDAVVDAERWQDDAERAGQPIVEAAALTAAAALLADLGGEKTLPVADPVKEAAAAVVRLIGESALQQAHRVVERLTAADRDGATMEELTGLVRDQEQPLTSWADAVATQAATATMASARDAAARTLEVADPDRDIQREWRSRRDAHVRPTHAKAHGQRQPLRQLFTVGDALLRFPADPLGPAGEVFNCRCVLNFRSRASGRYVTKPQLTGTGTETAWPAVPDYEFAGPAGTRVAVRAVRSPRP